jgi:hypothetical protein
LPSEGRGLLGPLTGGSQADHEVSDQALTAHRARPDAAGAARRGRDRRAHLADIEQPEQVTRLLLDHFTDLSAT